MGGNMLHDDPFKQRNQEFKDLILAMIAAGVEDLREVDLFMIDKISASVSERAGAIFILEKNLEVDSAIIAKVHDLPISESLRDLLSEEAQRKTHEFISGLVTDGTLHISKSFKLEIVQPKT